MPRMQFCLSPREKLSNEIEVGPEQNSSNVSSKWQSSLPCFKGWVQIQGQSSMACTRRRRGRKERSLARSRKGFFMGRLSEDGFTSPRVSEPLPTRPACFEDGSTNSRLLRSQVLSLRTCKRSTRVSRGFKIPNQRSRKLNPHIHRQ